MIMIIIMPTTTCLIKAKGLIGERTPQGKLIHTKSNFHWVFGERGKPENVRWGKPLAAE